MKNLKIHIEKICLTAISECFNISIQNLNLEETKEKFQGHFTLILFSLVKEIKKSTHSIGLTLGEYIKKKYYEIQSFTVVDHFLNLEISPQALNNFLNTNFFCSNNLQHNTKKIKKIMIEYSSPNTNKPLHLGHIRNNVLGFSISRILQSLGHEVIKTQIINDRGIHICKSMIAWIKYGDKETPKKINMKGDHFVGKYYLIFNQIYEQEIQELIKKGKTKEEAKKEAPILLQAKELLIKWENKDIKTHKIWEKMNYWVYQGFKISYKRLGVKFDITQYESNTYLIGKKIVQKGLKQKIFFKKKDGSIWCDLTSEGLDEKLLLRNDGTSVYITQDLGTTIERIKKYSINELIYIVGNEQNYHFNALFLIIKKLNISKKNQLLKHLSYGMVDLPEGKMKSRSGIIVDADSIMQEMFLTSKYITSELGKLNNINEQEKNKIYEIIGMGALKYYLLKIDPKKRILFDPKKSIDFKGNTGPFIQYTYTRINSLLKKSNFKIQSSQNEKFNQSEIKIILHLDRFNKTIQLSAIHLNPSIIANYIYNLVKIYNFFYQNHLILKEENLKIKNMRLLISHLVKNTIKNGLYLLGIQVPKKM